MINLYDEININETIWIPQKNENLTNSRVLNSKSTIEKCTDSSCIKYNTYLPKQRSMFLVNQNCMNKNIYVLKSDEIRKSNSNSKKSFNKNYIKKFDIEEKPITSKIPSSISTDLLIIDILNRFIFFMFLFFILSLNFLGLYILPYFLKKPLTIDD